MLVISQWVVNDPLNTGMKKLLIMDSHDNYYLLEMAEYLPDLSPIKKDKALQMIKEAEK